MTAYDYLSLMIDSYENAWNGGYCRHMGDWYGFQARLRTPIRNYPIVSVVTT